VQHFASGTTFDDAPEVHHEHLVARGLDDREIVGDEQVTEPQLLGQRRKQAEDLRLDAHVERRHRLVQNEQVGFRGKGASDGDSLGLATGEFARKALEQRGRQTNEIEQFFDAFATGVLVEISQRLERCFDGVADSAPWVQ